MGYMHPYVLRFVIVFIIILLTTAIVAFYPFLFGKLIDALFYNEQISLFIQILLIYLIIYMINQVLHYRLDVMVAKLRIDYSFDIKKSLFHKVLTYKSEHLCNLNTGDIIFRINNDADEALNMIYHDIFYGLSAFLDFSMCFGILAFINLPLSGISLLLVIVTFILTKIFEKRLKQLYDKITKLSASNQNWLFEFLNNMRDVQLINATKRCSDKYMEGENTVIDTNYDIVKWELVSNRFNAAVQVLSSLTIYTMAAIFIFQNMLTLGGLVACIDYFSRMVLTLNRMYSRAFTISRRMVSIDRVIEIEKDNSEDNIQTDPAVNINRGEIVFRNISFSYTKDKKILDGLNLHINAGEKIALVGKCGEGKSTLTELLCRLYDADQGEIIIDGRINTEYPLQDLRRQIGLVAQSTTIFNNTVRFNLVFTDDNKFDKEIWEALERVNMDQIIEKLPNGLDTILSPSNTGLSGGQCQRLSIARAYLKKPKILVFDESTSALDGNTEFNITKSWDTLFNEITILIIAHRLSTIIHCDRIAFLENGKIIACDTHQNLMASCKSYKKLFYEQYGYYCEGGENKRNENI